MMRKLVLAAIVCVALTTAGYAQFNVSFSIILDVSGTTGGSAYCTAYNPGDDTFISFEGGDIHVISAVDGLPTGATYDMTGHDTSGLGFFGIGADTLGNVYGVNANSGGMVRWANTTVAGATIATGCQFTRNMCIQGTGLNTLVGIAGAANTGDIVIYGTTDDISYSIIDSVTGIAKSGAAFDVGLTQAWGTPDIWNSVNKKVKVGGVWVSDNVIDGGVWDKPLTSTNIGAMWYDDVNNLLIGSDAMIDTLFAYDGTTAKQYGSQAYSPDAYGTIGYNGGWCGDLAVGSGRFYWGQRGWGGGSTGYHVGIADYGVTSVNDWTLY